MVRSVSTGRLSSAAQQSKLARTVNDDNTAAPHPLLLPLMSSLVATVSGQQPPQLLPLLSIIPASKSTLQTCA